MRHKQSKQERVGEIPYGYDLSANGVTLIPNVKEQEAIRLIHELRREGLSFRSIMVGLNLSSAPIQKGKT